MSASAEQELIVSSLREENQRVNRLYQRVLGALSLVLGVVHLYLAVHQLASPFDSATHAFLSSTTSSSFIVSCEMLGAFSLIACALYMDPGSCADFRTFWLATSLAGAAPPFVLWLIRFASFDEFPYHLIWLPCTPLGLALVCIYVKAGCEELEREAAELHNFVYRYKAV